MVMAVLTTPVSNVALSRGASPAESCASPDYQVAGAFHNLVRAALTNVTEPPAAICPAGSLRARQPH